MIKYSYIKCMRLEVWKCGTWQCYCYFKRKKLDSAKTLPTKNKEQIGTVGF